MTLKPCILCGEISDQSRCPEHRVAVDAKASARTRGYKTAWDKLSKRARRAQPWCPCGSVNDLTCDHIIPISVAPELALAIENSAVLCRSCNSKRGNKFTAAEAQEVLTRLQAAYNRRPTKQGRERINAAQNAVQTRGQAPPGQTQDPWTRQSLRVRS